MGQPYAGQGLMTDGLRAALPFVFDDLRLHRLEAACLPHNEPSKERPDEGRLPRRKAWRGNICGSTASGPITLLFALLRADYDALLRAPR